MISFSALNKDSQDLLKLKGFFRNDIREDGRNFSDRFTAIIYDLIFGFGNLTPIFFNVCLKKGVTIRYIGDYTPLEPRVVNGMRKDEITAAVESLVPLKFT